MSPIELDKSSEKISGMFAEIAPRYDFMNRLLSGFVDVYWRKYTARRLPISTDGDYLDVCTGTGDLLLEYYRRYGKIGRSFTGVDFCEPMLDLARKKIDRQIRSQSKSVSSFPTVSFGDACALPFDDNRFDLATVSFGLRNTADLNAALRQLNRVLKPGGVVGILEFSMPTGFFFSRLYKFYFRYVLPTLGKIFMNNSFNAYNYLPASVEQFPQGTELTKNMESCGFIDVSYTPLTFGIATLYRGVKREEQSE